MKKIIFFACLLTLSELCMAQTITILLQGKLSKIAGNAIPTNRTDQTSGFLGIDSVNFKTWGIEVVNFSFRQADINTSIKKGTTKEKLLAYYRQYGIDTTYFTDSVILENEIATFVSIDSKGRKYIKVDANNNKNFADDPLYLLDTGKNGGGINLKVKIKYFNGSQIKTFMWPLSITNESSFFSANVKDGGKGLPKKDPFAFSFINRAIKEGFLSVDGQEYCFQLNNRHNFLYKNELFRINISNQHITNKDSTQMNEVHSYQSTDSIPLGKHIYVVDNISDKVLSMRPVKLSPTGLGVVNSIAPELSGKDVLTQQDYSLEKQRGNYIIVDFWGTWCQPCINALPDLVKLHKKYPSVKILSVAYDKKEDIGKLIGMIKKQELSWNHLFVDRKNPGSILKDYQIGTYPTTLLIDPNGKILIRGVGKGVVSQIDNTLTSALPKQ